MRKIYFLFVFICCNNIYFGQIDIKTIFPPTPNVATLLKFTDQEVNLSRGTPKISIPIYNISLGTVNYPVSLEYFAGGNKVSDIASNVGLGWSLVGKGVLTRVVKNLPDDAVNGYMYNVNTIPVLWDKYFNDPSLRFEQYSMDLEPDLFRVSAGSLNISFYYDKANSKFIQVPLTDNKIIPTIVNGKLISWLVIDPYGNKYYFGTGNQVEYSESAKSISITDVTTDSGYTIPDFISSWYLTKIESPNTRTITFEYEVQPSYVLYSKLEESKILAFGNLPDEVNVPFKRNYAARNVIEKRLTKIKADSLEINFNSSTNFRNDFPGSKALDEITIKNGVSQLRKIKLNTDYFTSNPYFYYDHAYYSSYDNFRLKLNSVFIFEGSSSTPQKYDFTYNPLQLPNRNSFSQDAWGYFNGKNNTSLIPITDISDLTGVTIAKVGDADRSVSQINAQATILNKITYPTGGSIEYSYELNDADRINDISYPFNFSSTVDFNLGFMPDVNITQTDISVIQKPLYEKSFTLNNIGSFVRFNAQNEGCNSNYFNNTGCNFYLKVKNIDTNEEISINQADLSLKLPDGNYKLIAINRNNNSAMQYGFIVTLNYKQFENADGSSGSLGGGNTKIGGLRLKAYVLKDDNGLEVAHKNFIYKNNDRSSGNVLTYPIQVEKQYYTTASNSYKISSGSLSPFFNSGRPIYIKVTEINSNSSGENLGKIENFFEVDDRSNTLSVQPTTLSRNKSDLFQEWRNSLLLEQITYNRNNDIIKTVNNGYSSKHRTEITDFGLLAEYRLTDSYGPFYRYQFYPLFTENYSIDSTTTREFLDGRVLTTLTKYFYDNPLHYQVTSQSTVFPDQTTVLSTNQYAYEKNNQKLMDANMVGIPLETETKKNGKSLGRKETRYDNPANLLPSSVLSYDFLGAPTTEVTYDQYDAKGNLLQYTTKAGIPVAIIWGYNQTQPIAKIEGATYAQVQNLATALITASNADINAATEQTFITALDNFRKDPAMSGFQISTYTYNPLIGVTSITPPSGIREIYKYDSANRLQSVVDVNGKILKEYQYNYKP